MQIWKKDGKNRKDLLKAIHYVVLLMSSEDQDYIKEMEENADKQSFHFLKSKLTMKKK
jgi:hypothetical protein